MNIISVIALNSNFENMSLASIDALKNAELVVLKTENTPILSFIKQQNIPYLSLDSFYNQSQDFNVLNNNIVNYMLELSLTQNIVYAVFDPMFDSSVQQLLSIIYNIKIIPYVSAVQEYIALFPKVIESHILLSLSASEFKSINPDPQTPCLFVEINSMLLASQVKLKLMNIFNDDYKIYYFINGEQNQINLYELDRQNSYNHTSAAYIPACDFKQRNRYNFNDLLIIMDILKSKDGCPWDRKQTHKSLRQYLIEESYETIEAIDNEDFDALCEELGDVLLNVVFHAAIAKQHGNFDINDITTEICKKMIDRHVHVFKPNNKLETPEEVLKSWNEIKKQEKGINSIEESINSIPKNMGALMRANKVISKLENTNINKTNSDNINIEKLLRSEHGLKIDEEFIGNLLFSIVRFSKKHSIEPELALTSSIENYIKTLKNY